MNRPVRTAAADIAPGMTITPKNAPARTVIATAERHGLIEITCRMNNGSTITTYYAPDERVPTPRPEGYCPVPRHA